MKNKVLIVNTIMGLVVLFALLFQSFHAVGHLKKQFIEKQCHHQYNHNKTEINHAHTGFEHCFTCEFTFSSLYDSEPNNVNLKNYSSYFKPTYLTFSENISFYNGSSFLLRGPPRV